jgi:hypothetical protein
MKSKSNALSRRYLAALGKHLKQSPGTNLEPARALGRKAVAIGLETLDLARIHEQALAALGVSGFKEALIKRAEVFFTEAITPIEQTHRAALETGAHLDRLNKALNHRTVDLAAANRSLKQGIARRKAVEAALKQSEEHYTKLLEESLALQKHLQHLAHRILSAQEAKRKKIRQNLQGEIAQTLLGIHVRLLTVKKAAGLKGKALQKEFASTQRLVDMSVKGIKQFAREFGKQQEA